jgi:hypothetical protein
VTVEQLMEELDSFQQRKSQVENFPIQDN